MASLSLQPHLHVRSRALGSSWCKRQGLSGRSWGRGARALVKHVLLDNSRDVEERVAEAEDAEVLHDDYVSCTRTEDACMS